MDSEVPLLLTMQMYVCV